MTQYNKEYYEAHKEGYKAASKAYYEAHKEAKKARVKSYNEVHKEEMKAYKKAYYQAHKEELNAYNKLYNKSNVNSFGQSKANVRRTSRQYLYTHGKKIQGYEIHHCFTYDEPRKFIYCSKEMHLKIHQYLRDNNIDADSNHYEQIKHLLDETVIVYGV